MKFWAGFILPIYIGIHREGFLLEIDGQESIFERIDLIEQEYAVLQWRQ